MMIDGYPRRDLRPREVAGFCRIATLLCSITLAVSSASVASAETEDLADSTRRVLAEASLDGADAGAGAVPLRDSEGRIIGLAAVAVGFEPSVERGFPADATPDQRRRAAALAASIALRREMLAYLDREIETRDRLVRRCVEIWRRVDGEDRSIAVDVEESASQIVETCRGLLARAVVIEMTTVDGGVRVMGYAVPGEWPRLGEAMLVADSPEQAKAMVERDLVAGVRVDPGTVVVADASGRPRSVIAWATRDGENHVAEVRARAAAQRTLLAFLKGDRIDSESRFERWSRTMLLADESMAASWRTAIDAWDETHRDRIASRVSGQARQLGEAIRRADRTTVFTVAEWADD